MRPLAVDLYSGLHGFAEGLVAAGFEVLAFDIEDMCGKFGMPRPEHVHLVLQDVRSLHGRQFKDAELIVGSSPCQEFSYRAMPWKRAKALGPPTLGIELFNAQFRIQREACEAAGRHIPLVVENVRGAQKWVGRSRWNYGSYHLWGDVPALMPMTMKRHVKIEHREDIRRGAKVTPRLTNPAEHFKNQGGSCVSHSGNSTKRRLASAMIARIPFPLSYHIGRTYLPVTSTVKSATSGGRTPIG
jgi:hypothetical protein